MPLKKKSDPPENHLPSEDDLRKRYPNLAESAARFAPLVKLFHDEMQEYDRDLEAALDANGIPRSGDKWARLGEFARIAGLTVEDVMDSTPAQMLPYVQSRAEFVQSRRGIDVDQSFVKMLWPTVRRPEKVSVCGYRIREARESVGLTQAGFLLNLPASMKVSLYALQEAEVRNQATPRTIERLLRIFKKRGISVTKSDILAM